MNMENEICVKDYRNVISAFMEIRPLIIEALSSGAEKKFTECSDLRRTFVVNNARIRALGKTIGEHFGVEIPVGTAQAWQTAADILRYLEESHVISIG